MPSASPFVESRVDLFDRQETEELARRLNCSLVTAVGHLHALWHHCLKKAPLDGDLSQYGERDLARAARWEGDPAVLQAALLDGEWIERDGHIHNWVLYYGKLGETRASAVERQRRRRAAVRGFSDQDIWSRDHGKCRYCGAGVTIRSMKVSWVVTPKRGGTLCLDNAVTACEACCKRKWGHLPNEVGMPVMGLLVEAGVSVTRDADSLKVSLTRDADLVLVTRDSDSAYSSTANGAAAAYVTRDADLVSVTRDADSGRASGGEQKVNNVMNGLVSEHSADSQGQNLNNVHFLEDSSDQNNVQISAGAQEPTVAPSGVSVTRDADREPDVNRLTGSSSIDKPVDAPELNRGVQGGNSDEPPAAEPKKRGSKKALKPETQAAVDRLFAAYKELVQPHARVCPTEAIARRLENGFSEADLLTGIQKFANDEWWMEHCASNGAPWFFQSDKRAEQFLLLRPRGRRNPDHDAQNPWVADLEKDGHLIRRRTLVSNDDSHTPPVTEEPPMIGATAAPQDDSDVAF